MNANIGEVTTSIPSFRMFSRVRLLLLAEYSQYRRLTQPMNISICEVSSSFPCSKMISCVRFLHVCRVFAVLSFDPTDERPPVLDPGGRVASLATAASALDLDMRIK